MSYMDLKKALEKAPQCRFYTTEGGKSEEIIRQAEKMLGLSFSPQCMEFYKTCGYLSFYGNEIFGIDTEEEPDVLEGNSVAYALYDRKQYALPEEWLPIYDYGDGTLAYLDYANKNAEGEPRVICAYYNGKQYVVADVVAEDFGAFLLERVMEALSE